MRYCSERQKSIHARVLTLPFHRDRFCFISTSAKRSVCWCDTSNKAISAGCAICRGGSVYGSTEIYSTVIHGIVSHAAGAVF